MITIIPKEDSVNSAMHAQVSAADRVPNETSIPRRRRDVPNRPIRARLSGAAKRLLLSCVDNGWLGLTPLEKHVVICGYQRSGSTLLQLMIECCISEVKVFGRERSALNSAQTTLRNHSIMVTKKPSDVFAIDAIREFYSTRKAKPQFVITLRDPRSVLTSRHVNWSEPYYVTPDVWLKTYEAYRRVRMDPDVAAVRYEDLTTNPATVESKLTELIGWRLTRPFARYLEVASARKLDRQVEMNLNGLRELDRSRCDAWRDPSHRDRIAQVLSEIRDFPKYVIELGYETDTEWAKDYLWAGSGG